MPKRFTVYALKFHRAIGASLRSLLETICDVCFPEIEWVVKVLFR